jgi:hypothetical protein
VRLVAGIGLEGDRYATRLGTYSKNHHIDRQATLIEVEALEALARDRRVMLAPHEHRRNLTTRGVPLNHLVGQYFRLGDCVLYGGRLNVPCLYLEHLLHSEDDPAQIVTQLADVAGPRPEQQSLHRVFGNSHCAFLEFDGGAPVGESAGT